MPARLRQTGAGGGLPERELFAFEWHGNRVLQTVDDGIAEGLLAFGAFAEQLVKASIHVITGEERAGTFHEVDTNAKGNPVLVVGDDVDYALWEEIGNRFRPGHHTIRRGMDQATPQLTRFLRAAVRARLGG